MSPRFVFQLLLVVAFPVIGFGQLDSDAIDIGLDVSEDVTAGTWFFEKESDDSKVEVIDDEGAEQASYVQVTVAAGTRAVLKRNWLPTPTRISFKYRLDAWDGTSYEIRNWYDSDYGHRKGSFPAEDYEVGTWATGYGANSYAPDWGWEFVAGESDLVVCLDAMTQEDGFAISIIEWGTSVSVTPEKELYQIGEYVTVKTEPAEEGIEFLGWKGWFEDQPAEWSGVFTDSEPIPFLEAVGGRRYSFDGVDVLVPLRRVESAAIEEDGEVVGIDLVPETIHETISVFYEVEGPGVLRFEGRGKSDFAQINSRYLRDNPEYFETRFGVGTFRFEGTVSGNVELSGFSFEKGYPVAVSTVGGGTVEGVPESGLLGVGELLELSAVPEEGWRFEGWEGTLRSSNAELSVEVYEELSLEAHFAMDLEFQDLDTSVHGESAWQLATGENGPVLKAPQLLESNEENRLRWVVNGPGTFSFLSQSLEGYGIVIVDGYAVDSINPGGQEVEPQLHRYEFDGYVNHVIEVRLDGSGSYDLMLSEVSWKAGWQLVVNSTVGGSVSGVEEGETLVADGTELTLSAEAEEGYSFVGWIGDVEGIDPELDVSIFGDTEITAVFEMAEDEGDWVSSQDGFGSWSLVDGKWRSPDSLPKNGYAALNGSVVGPQQLQVRLASVGEGEWGGAALRYVVDGETRFATLGLYNSTITLPEGVHEVSILCYANENGDYQQVELANFSHRYLVDIDVTNGSLAVSPYMGQPDYSLPRRRDYVAEGTTLQVTASAVGSAVFHGWAGSFAGESEVVEYEVVGPITTSANYGYDSFVREGVTWTVVDGSGVYELPYDPNGIGFDGSSETVTLKTRVTGPGMLYAFSRNLAGAEIKFGEDGEFVELALSGAFEIPEGELDVFVRATLPEFIIPRSQWVVSHGFYQLAYYPGYFVYGTNQGEGSVTLSRDGYVFEEGTELTVTAVPRSRNEFVGWISPEGELEESFEWVVDGPESFVARFQAQALQNEVEWTYDGVAPSAGPYDTGPYKGVFWWSINPAETGQAFSASATVTGPGTLWVDTGHMNPSQSLLEGVFVDGNKVEGMARTFEGTVYGVPVSLDAGDHTVEVRGTTPESEQWYYLNLQIPTLQTTFTIEAEGEYSANVEIEGVREDGQFSIGETVTFTAPETSPSGETFLGWWQYGYDGGFVQSDRTISFEATEDMKLEARYGNVLESFEGAVVYTTNGEWNEDATELTPLGETSHRVYGTGSFRVYSEEDSVLRFAAKVEAGGLSLIRDSKGYTESAIGDEKDWVIVRVPLEAGESVTLYTSYPYRSSNFGDFVLESNSVPAQVVQVGRELSVQEGEMEGYYEISVDEADEDVFVGWLQKREIISMESTIQVEGLDGDLLRPLYLERVETSLGEVVLSHERGWSSDSMDGLGYEDEFLGFVTTSFYWDSDLGEYDPMEESIHIPVTGPVTMFWRATGEGFEVRVDGELVELLENPLGDLRKAYSFGAGDFEISFTHQNSGTIIDESRAQLSDIEVLEGVAAFRVDQVGGSVFPVVAGGVFAIGEALVYTAEPDAGYDFIGWKAPYADEGRYVEISNGVDAVPEAIFEEAEPIVFEASGFEWMGYGVQVEESYSGNYDSIQHQTVIDDVDNGPAKLVTEITGPGVLWVSKYEGLENYSLDGSPLNDKGRVNVFTNNEGISIGLSAGPHRLQIDYGDGFAGKTIGTPIVFKPGYLLMVEGVGCELASNPDVSVVPAGMEVTLRSNAGASTDWRGLPAGAEVDGGEARFTMTDHVSVHALKWREREYFGVSVGVASDYDLEAKYGSYETEFLTNRGSIYLRVTGVADQVIDFDFSVGGNWLTQQTLVQASVNGKALPTEWVRPENSSDYHAKSRAYLTVESDVFEFAFHEQSVSISLAAKGNLRRVATTASEITPYEAWWLNQLGEIGEDRGRILPRADFDLDGWPNWVEWDFGYDALRSEPGLELVRWGEGEYLLILPELTTEQAAKLALKAFADGEVVSGEERLEAEPVDLAGETRTVREVKPMGSGIESQLFYYEYAGEIPSEAEVFGDE